MIPKTDLCSIGLQHFSFVGGSKTGLAGTIECSGELNADKPGVALHECDLGEHMSGLVPVQHGNV